MIVDRLTFDIVSDTDCSHRQHAIANDIYKGRLQFDAGWTDIAQSFMAIRKTLTPSGRAVTYDAGRSEETGHADLAWAVMHALDHEPFEGGTQTNQSFMEMYA